MSKPRALSTGTLFPAARAILDQHFEVEHWTERDHIPRVELLKRIADKEALICLIPRKVNEELLASAQNAVALFEGRRPPNAVNADTLGIQ